jgi:tetratricopeptide (TPR) repeat protein
MRLLHFDALGKLILTDFRGKPIPPYAILSHRWGHSEILLEDVSNGNYKEKEEGYQKLKFCSEQAAQDGLHHLWIDTCCIDRWDNNERSKAINSMFQWYQNAARCYVMLSDVSLSGATKTATHSGWEALFRQSKWFTRGWTLQELIAPTSVEFFSREGQRIGDKTSLEQLIHDITKIPLTALRNCPLDQFSTSERRRWVEKRTTTEDEDIVYCLLGLLGISMPTTYGEGISSASKRLQAEIEGAGSAPSVIPFSRNESFVGRELQLAELEGKLFSNEQTTTTLAIVGCRGTGKSQLALEAGHRIRQNMKNCSVFWIDASNKDSLRQSYASVAQKLRVPGWDDDLADIKQLAQRCVVEMSARQCLLIFDNAEYSTLRSGGPSATEAAILTNYLPHSKLCSVLFTTTNSDACRSFASQNVIVLQEPTPKTALRMLQVRLARPISNTEQQEAEHLLSELSYLPLAVVQAAACMNASGMTVQQYRLRLDEHKELDIEPSSDLVENLLRGSGVKDPVTAVLFLSMDQINRENTFATDYLCLTACVDRKDISLDLLEAPSIRIREDAIKVLEKYALITRRPAESALDLHEMIHQALRKRLQEQGQFIQWTQRIIIQLLQVFPDGQYRNRSKWRRLLPHVQYALSYRPVNNDDEGRLQLASRCAMHLRSDGRYNESEELEVQVVQTKKRLLGDEHPDTLTSMANLALTYCGQGRWRDAEELEVQVMQITKKVLGNKHPHTLSSMANLASTYWNQGRWKEAKELQVHVVQTKKRALSGEHPDMLASINNLASIYMDQGRWEEAEELQVQVMETAKRVLGNEHPDTLTSMANLASTYENQERWQEAEELEVQVVQTKKRVLGDEHPSTLSSIHNLGLTYLNRGRLKEAEEVQVQVMDGMKRVLGDEHPNMLTTMSNLASTYWNQGRWKEAEEMQAQVVQTTKRVLGDEHPSTLTRTHNFAFMLQAQAQHEEALALMERCFQLRQQVLGRHHPDTQSSLDALSTWQAE